MQIARLLSKLVTSPFRALALATAVFLFSGESRGVEAIAESVSPVSLEVDREAGEFTLIVVPDTQRYSAFFPDIMQSQFEWIRDHAGALNAKYVLHVGDLVEEGEEHEWVAVNQAFSLIDEVVPYLVIPGNHDYDRAAYKAGFRNASHYNAVFPTWRFQGRNSFGGSMGLTNNNNFGYFEAADQKFMVLGLEFGPGDETLAWADSLVSNHDQNVILVTHAYMYYDQTRLGPGDKWSPKKIDDSWNDGEDIWNKLVSPNGNIVMVLSGHVKGDGAGLLISPNEDDKPVIQMLSNYQFLTHGGQGWLRIMKFQPASHTLKVYTYSPWLKKFRTEPDQQFIVPAESFFLPHAE